MLYFFGFKKLFKNYQNKNYGMENRWRMDIWMMQLLRNRCIPIVTEEKAELIEIRNQNTSMALFLPFNNMLYLYQPQISSFWKIYFESLQAN